VRVKWEEEEEEEEEEEKKKKKKKKKKKSTGRQSHWQCSIASCKSETQPI
jgi:hypothetical protein